MRSPVLAVLVLALVLAGCGGSDSADDASERRASSAGQKPGTGEFVRDVDALCREANPELAAGSAALTRARDAARAGRVSLPETFRRFVTLLRRASETTDRLRARLRAIAVPRQERTFHTQLMNSLERGSRNLRQQVRAAEAQDAVRLRELSLQGSVINARAKGLVNGHGGFRHCGRA